MRRALSLPAVGLLVLLASSWVGTFPAMADPAAEGAPAVASVTIEGTSRVDPSSVEKALPFKAGDPWRERLATEAVKAVYRLGAFAKVEVDAVPAGGQRVAVTVRVKEHPLLRSVALSGNSALTGEELKPLLTMKAFGFFDPADYPAQVDAIRKAYEAKGYYQVAVTPRAEEVPASAGMTEGGVKVTFDISEGGKTLVTEVDILGNEGIPDAEIKKVLLTGERGPLSFMSDSGVVEQAKLKEDLERIRMVYFDHGYLDVKVEEPVVRPNAEGDGLYVGIRVSEGRRYQVGAVDISGEFPDPEAARKAITLAPGDVAERGRIVATLQALETVVKDQGYARARVSPDMAAGKGEGTIDLTFKLARGPLTRVRRIEITGNLKTRDYVIRRELLLQEGDLYSQRKVDKSIRQVRGLGFIETVEIKPRPVQGEGGTPEEGLIDLAVTVKEGSSGTLAATLSYSSNDGLVGGVQHTQRNLFGRGQRLSLDAQSGSKGTTYSVSFTEPRVFSGGVSLGVDLFDQVKEYTSYAQDQRGGSLRFGYRLEEDASLTLRYRYAWYRVYDVDPDASTLIQEMAGESTTSSLRLGYLFDTRDYPLDPRSGYTIELTGEVAGGALGGTNDFLRGVAEASWFHPLVGDLVFSAHAQAGWIQPFNGDTLPVSERFFMGGMGTVRGFEYRGVGPEDEDGEALGGTRSLLFNLEAAYPLAKEPLIKGILFLDAGNVWADGEVVDTSDLRAGAGAGFRWLSPMGLLRLEWGINLDPRPGERQPGWEFSIGTSF